ncbi:sugar ABC transporter substrate-binding protein [Tranquillimonas alkanivorans]|uniref:Monosaccharide ABC transporter substrate-binding protein, CUT2 family n=1 Tax=Tranquillimonas alkanivorans TaxID=441119 RepID=A0A1I5VK08_9RHOB|nr:substrate-binding domain-containing protein [Tranquillimonas alkanivorans]SFQ07809.1 monosaccharide ABC transporter substrate-binding protein, CUT2 family [Tranquillimonas alkanivorans]
MRKSIFTTAASMALLLSAGVAQAADTKAALIPGGPHPYFAAWEDAAAAAAEDFGVEAEYSVPPAWELSQQNEMIESLVAQGYNAFLVFPGDASGTNATLGELDDFEIPSATLAGCTEAPTPALFCLGTDVYNSAYLGTQELIDAMGGSGQIAHFTGFLVDPNTQLRIDAVEKAASEHDGVEVMQVIADIDAPEPADEKINAFLAAQGDEVDGIVTTAWVPAVVAATSLRNLGDQRIKMVGIDHDQVVLDAIKDGFVHGTMLQNPYGQGYIGVYAMDLVRSGCTMKDDAPWLTTAQTDRFIDSGTAFVGADQVDNYQDAMVQETDKIMADFKDTYMNCPN